MYPRLAATFRAVRIRRGWRQEDVAARAGVSRAAVSLIERGELEGCTLRHILTVAEALGIRIDLMGRWRGGDLERLLNAKHSALHERVAVRLARLADWVFLPEVSFAVRGERGVIDILAWHPATRSLLIIELKTEFVDMQETIGTIDRKRRLARLVAGERGWCPRTVSAWLIVSEGRTNRRHAAAHGALLRAAFPTDGRMIREWLRAPAGMVSAMSFWSSATGGRAGQPITPVRRVRPVRRPDRGPVGA